MSLSLLILPVAVAAESPRSCRRVAPESPPLSLGAGSGAATL
jgi:hypothetical protein